MPPHMYWDPCFSIWVVHELSAIPEAARGNIPAMPHSLHQSHPSLYLRVTPCESCKMMAVFFLFRNMGRKIQRRRRHFCFTWLWCQSDLPNTEERHLGANAVVQGHERDAPPCPLSPPAWLPLCQWGFLWVTGDFHRNSWEHINMDSALKEHVLLTQWEVWVQLYFLPTRQSD